MNYLIDGFYNDFKTINNFTGVQRAITKRDVILKNAAYLYRTIGIPEVISSSAMYQWTIMLEENRSPNRIKKQIWIDMNKLQPLWRKLFTRERIVCSPLPNFVISHAWTQAELQVAGKMALVIWIDCDDLAQYQHAWSSSKGTFPEDIYDKDFISELYTLRQKADFVITNNGSKKLLYTQLNDIKEILEI